MPENQIEKMQDRFKEVRLFLGYNQNDFAKKTGLSQGQVSSIEKKRRNITGAILIMLEDKLSISRKWIETGGGDMFIHANESKSNLVQEGIPMYDSVAAASQVEVYSDGGDLTPKFRVSIPQFADCEFGKMVFGHSMEPTISNGTYVFCKRIQDKRFIVPGEIYYLEYANHAIVKRLQLSNKPSELIAESDNPELRPNGERRFEAFAIPVDEIRALFLVKGSFQQTQN